MSSVQPVASWIDAQIGLSQAILSVESRSSILTSDHVLTTVGGLAKSLASQFLRDSDNAGHTEPLRALLLADKSVFTSLLANAAELFGLEYLYATARLNPALPSAMGQLVQAEDTDLAELTREFLGAHVRTVQSLRRQHLDVMDLSGETFSAALACASQLNGDRTLIDGLKNRYDESAARTTYARRLARGLLATGAAGEDDISRFGFTLTAAILAERSALSFDHAVLALVGDRECVTALCHGADLGQIYVDRLMSWLPGGAAT